MLGRFINEDSLGFLGGDENLYAYAAEDPVDFSDPSGLKLDPKPGNGVQGGLDLADYLAALQYLNQDPGCYHRIHLGSPDRSADNSRDIHITVARR